MTPAVILFFVPLGVLPTQVPYLAGKDTERHTKNESRSHLGVTKGQYGRTTRRSLGDGIR